jgi:tetratricopeptide (TPR) repeat protein
MNIKSEKKQKTEHICFLLLVALVTYGNTLLNGFVYDDYTQIVENPFVHNFRHLREIFTTSVGSFQGAEGILSYYRPVMSFGYLICWQISGPIPFLYHICNVFLNCAAVLLVYFLGLRLFDDAILSLTAATIFALHPIHTESVAWVSGVTDVELTVFYLVAFWVFLDLPRASNQRYWARRILMGVSFALALLSKEQAATLPVLATIYEHFYRDDRENTSPREKAGRYGILWVLNGAYLLLRAGFLGGLLPSRQRTGVSLYEVVLSGLALLGQYFGRLLWPSHLALFHDFHKNTSPFQLGVIFGLSSLLICALLLVRTGIRHPASFSMIWLFVTLAPVLNIRWLVTSVIGERYLYLPSVGFCWIVAYGARKLWLLLDLRPFIWRRALTCAICAIGVICLVQIVRRNMVWHDQETFVRQIVAASPNGSVALATLGAIDWNKGDLPAAEREWLEAAKTRPDDSDLLEDFALLRAKEQRYPEAIDYFRRLTEQRPAYTQAHLEFGELYEKLDRNEDAEIQYRTAVAIAPANVRARNHLGTLLFNEHRLAPAEQQFQRSVESDWTAVAYDRLGDIQSGWNQKSQAELDFVHATSLDPFDAYAHFSLGGLYEARGLAGKAIGEYEAGLQMDPSNAVALTALRRLTP